MKMKINKIFKSSLYLTLLSLHPFFSYSLPLSVNKRWIIDEASSNRVKMACVNWPAHMQAMIAEGFDKRSLSDITLSISNWGFNCVRLTYATHMFTRFANNTVAQTFDSLKLLLAKSGIARYNPWAMNMTHVQAFEIVVDELGKHNLMVVIDNHVSNPNWCCSETDGNGFFGDKEFHLDEWLKGLYLVAMYFRNKTQVVAMSLRNELRGARQNQHDWYQYMSLGANTIHLANPNLLVIVGGLSYSTDLSFLKNRPFVVNVGNKLVFEGHWYSIGGGPKNRWEVQPLNRVCGKAMQWFDNNNGFLINGTNSVPLFMTEFGGDQREVSKVDNKFFTCAIAYASARDLDWGLWALSGSYYIRQGKPNFEETFSVFDYNWTNLRNPMLPTRLKLMQSTLQGVNASIPKSYILFHTLSGQCIQVNNKNEIYMGDCKNWSKWNQNEDGAPIRLLGGSNPNLCLNVVGNNLPPTISNDCWSKQSSWRVVSNSMLHLSALDKNDELLCLEKDANSSQILTRSCICIVDDSNCLQDPQSQWFQLIPTNVN